MPPALVLGPPAVLALSGAACWVLGKLQVRGAGATLAAGAWLAAIVYVTLWGLAGRAPLELALGVAPAGIPFAVRLDSVVVVFELLLLVPVGLLAAFRPRQPAVCALAALAVLAAALSIESARALLTALGVSICATVLVGMIWHEDERGFQPVWVAFSVGWLLLLWAALLLEVTGGTSVYVAAPITAFRVPLFLLLSAAAMILAGLLPWGSWLSGIWSRPRLDSGVLAVAVMVPLGFLLVARTYSLSGGRWPAGWLNPLMAAAGGLVGLGAVIRAQAATDLRGYLREVVPLGAGVALLGMALGTPLGLDGGLIALLGVGLLAGLAPLLAHGSRPVTLLGIAIAAGVPPALVFGGWLLTVQAAFAAGSTLGFAGLLGAGVWLLGLAASARALHLPPADPAAARASAGAWAAAVLAIALGVGLAAVEAWLTLPATGELVKVPAALAGGAQVPISLAAAGWSPLLLGLPLTVLAVVAALFGRRAAAARLQRIPDQVPPPLLKALAVVEVDRIRERAASAEVPADYRSMLDLTGVARYVRSSQPWFWVVVTIVLAVLVTR